MKNINKSNRELAGKTVVITGGSSGVGRAAAEAFALEGCNIVIAARGEEGIAETVKLCHDLGVMALGIKTDVSDFEQVRRLAEEAKSLNGRIDIWVNNAGVMASGKFEEIPMEVHHQTVDTNLLGYIHGAYVALPIFKAQGEGVLINNVSIGGYMPAPYSAVYSATKGGIKMMMSGLQGEISNEPNIHICNIYPQIQRSTGNMHSAKYSGLEFKIPPFAADPRDTAKAMVSLAKNPRKDLFPDFMSKFIKNTYQSFPSLVMNGASAVMRLGMKVKNAPDDGGNILKPSEEPHRIYGETMLPVPSKKTKKIALAGLILAAGICAFRRKNKD
ncbi:SDR family NAD(P)-dependent oxidoreductase [Cruoricaptor ignavus]|uniref:SDR family NAD(P)-dependent oxidoreductase n=1 Tax=Cruoricaptor ignavus TaxID=1118202 RepID=UPI00370D99CC